MASSWNRWSRKLHRWGALVTFVPMLLVIVTGLLLQVKKQVAWVQPPTIRGSGTTLRLDWDRALALLKTYEQADVNGWEDVDRIDVRPDKGVAKIRCRSRWELQIDTATGAPLAFAYRRSDLIESLHDGSFFSDAAKLWIFLPNGLILLGLWFTGVWLWWMPFGAKRKKRQWARRKSGTPPLDSSDPPTS